MKSSLKFVCQIIAMLCVSPLYVTHWVISRLGTPDLSLESHSQLLACIPGTTGSYLRVAFYRAVLEHCDPTAYIGFGVLLSKTGASIHEHVYIGPRCLLGLVTLEQDVLLGPSVQIPSGPNTHGIERLDVPIRTQPGQLQRTTIGHDSWIGAGSIVLADVSPQTVVGAGSVVTRQDAAGVIVAGNPARVIRHRQEGTEFSRNDEMAADSPALPSKKLTT